MSEHKVSIHWQSQSEDFSYKAYDRTHTWNFEGGTEVRASSAPEFLGKIEYVNPEEALVAALSSCHMLTFLAIASRRKFVVKNYTDHAVGLMQKNDKGKLAITKVYLKPKIEFGGTNLPDQETIENMHHLSHEECFIANSVLTQIIVEPVF
jgi:organic hydroperoxide reductase OsmC/OhrA